MMWRYGNQLTAIRRQCNAENATANCDSLAQSMMVGIPYFDVAEDMGFGRILEAQ
jgi:hypothetical protein